MSKLLIDAGALRQFRHNDDVSQNAEMVPAYDKTITDRVIAALQQQLGEWQEAYENMRKFAEDNGLNTVTAGDKQGAQKGGE